MKFATTTTNKAQRTVLKEEQNVFFAAVVLLLLSCRNVAEVERKKHVFLGKNTIFSSSTSNEQRKVICHKITKRMIFFRVFLICCYFVLTILKSQKGP
jgi:hypothetical protein